MNFSISLAVINCEFEAYLVYAKILPDPVKLWSIQSIFHEYKSFTNPSLRQQKFVP